ncbi:MAG: sulfatase [Acidobacteria bacterium]|nr:sulfatase [Acidobacteriota bacterium]
MNRRGFLAQLAAATATPRPNVLFIAVDDLRPEFGAYGAPFVLTPNLDRLAHSSVVFERAYCQSALCNPSRSSMLTGLRPDTLKVWDLQTDFRIHNPGAITLPQHFREQGYQTIGSGKIFHNIFPDPPSWSEEIRIPGYPFDPDAVYRSPSELVKIEAAKQQIIERGQQKRHMDRYNEWYLKSSATEAPDVPDSAYFDGAQTDIAVSKLKQLQSSNKPFFYGIGYYRPHLPFNAPKRYWDLYDRSKLPLASNPNPPVGVPLMANNRNRELRGYKDFTSAPTPDQGPLTEAQARLLRHGYFASVSYIDAQIGRLLNQIDSNTIVVLWGDHGYKLGEHRAWGKMTNFEIDTRVPLMIRSPRLKPHRFRGLVESIDIYPTLCALAGLTTPKDLEGLNLLNHSQGKPAAFSQYLRDGIWTAPDGNPYMGYTIRTATHRYVEWRTWPAKQLAATELYNEKQDPRETINIAPRNPGLSNNLARQLRQQFNLA